MVSEPLLTAVTRYPAEEKISATASLEFLEESVTRTSYFLLLAVIGPI
jgi:hypothetical protein